VKYLLPPAKLHVLPTYHGEGTVLRKLAETLTAVVELITCILEARMTRCLFAGARSRPWHAVATRRTSSGASTWWRCPSTGSATPRASVWGYPSQVGQQCYLICRHGFHSLPLNWHSNALEHRYTKYAHFELETILKVW